MASILDICVDQGVSRRNDSSFRGGDLGALYILAEGRIEVLRGDTEVAVVDDAGAVFGEMSVLLNRPHTARVRAKFPVRVYVFDDAASFLKSNPEIAFFLGRLLAERLNDATTYLVDLKRQFEGHGNHLGMVGEVLETLIHQQHEDFTLGPKGETDPLRLREAGGRREKQISSTRLFVRSPTRTENHKVRQRKIHGEADGDRNKLGS